MSSLSSPCEATSSITEGKTDPETVVEQGVSYLPITSHDYTYQGYYGTYPTMEDHGYFPHTGTQAENTSLVYRVPSYISYSPEQVIGTEGQSLGQQPYLSSPGYPKHAISSSSESVPVCSFDPKPSAENLQPGLADSRKNVSCPRSAALSSSEGSSSIKPRVTVDAKASSKPSDLKPRHPISSSNFPGQPIEPLNKASQLDPGIRPVRVARGYHHSSSLPSLANQGKGSLFPRNNVTRPMPIHQTVNNNDCSQMKGKFHSHKSYGPSSELVCGPRANGAKKSSSSSAEISSNPFVRREQLNRPDFQVKYDQAKFFMIKSYSEDDIHKSIKYSVWSSTPNGNNKLDAAFRDAEKEKNEKGVKCPIFLFFSVNASGQFVGLAEMTGPVDFKKNMDFWQQDKWNGFFPVKWHIIKDIPNRLFHHITLENNDNKEVTFSRDTQEIRLPQGLRMLQIFKSHRMETSILDDFDFYEQRESTLSTTRRNRSVFRPSEIDFDGDSSLNHMDVAFRKMTMSARSVKPPHSLTNFSKSLSFNNQLMDKRS